MPVSMKTLSMTVLLGVATISLSGCAQTFGTRYDTAIPAEASRQWTVSDIRVVIPQELTTTDVNALMPAADIVWHGEPRGDRKAQVGAILEEATRRATADLKGRLPVIVTVTLQRFHSLTPRAYGMAPAGTGVHSAVLTVAVTDARSGALIAGPTPIEASIPAQTAAEGGAMPGAAWRSQISSHLTATLRGWLGTGPDNRGSFTRIGS